MAENANNCEELVTDSFTKEKIKKAKALTEDEFFDLPDLRQRKATIRVCILGEKRYNQQTGKIETIKEDKEIVVSPNYWDAVHRTNGEPTDPQKLVGYNIDGVYSEFKK
jgi:hypothetical protein